MEDITIKLDFKSHSVLKGEGETKKAAAVDFIETLQKGLKTGVCYIREEVQYELLEDGTHVYYIRISNE